MVSVLFAIRKNFFFKQPLYSQNCFERNVTRSYHVLCDGCTVKLQQCGKCRQNSVAVPIYTEQQRRQDAMEREKEIASMSERARRSYFRNLRRQRRVQREAGDDTTELDMQLQSDVYGTDEEDEERKRRRNAAKAAAAAEKALGKAANDNDNDSDDDDDDSSYSSDEDEGDEGEEGEGVDDDEDDDIDDKKNVEKQILIEKQSVVVIVEKVSSNSNSEKQHRAAVVEEEDNPF